MATDYIDKNPLNTIQEKNESSTTRKNNKNNVRQVASETGILIDDPSITKENERVTSLVGHPDYHWSWYGYSRGYVQDGFIRDDNKFVIKERFVGNSSFLFNHKDYTNTAVQDYFKNMDVKRKHEINDTIIKNDHDLKINHVPKNRFMKSPDVFKTNVNIKSVNQADPRNENARLITNENPIDDVNSKNDNNKKIVTEYIDEINVTILKEDIEINEKPIHENEVRHVYLATANDGSNIENDLMNSFEQISYESIIDKETVEETTVEEIITEKSNSPARTITDLKDNKSEVKEDSKEVEFAILSSIEVELAQENKTQNTQALIAPPNTSNKENDVKPKLETEVKEENPPSPTGGVVKFNNVTLIHRHDESDNESPTHQKTTTEIINHQYVETRTIANTPIENTVIRRVSEDGSPVKEGDNDFRWEGVFNNQSEKKDDEEEMRDGSDDYVVIDFDGCDSSWKDNLSQSQPVPVES